MKNIKSLLILLFLTLMITHCASRSVDDETFADEGGDITQEQTFEDGDAGVLDEETADTNDQANEDQTTATNEDTTQQNKEES